MVRNDPEEMTGKRIPSDCMPKGPVPSDRVNLWKKLMMFPRIKAKVQYIKRNKTERWVTTAF